MQPLGWLPRRLLYLEESGRLIQFSLIHVAPNQSNNSRLKVL